jgi:hypothetical protein
MKNISTKRIIIGLSMLLTSAFAFSQNGLENVLVEKYYISDANDEAGSIGILPVGSVTYRIFVDMLPGYNFQMAYGSQSHTLLMNTTTSFFNNEDRGGITPTFTKAQAKNNTVMLDSWLSAGAACVGNFGILKAEDNGVANVVNGDGLLMNDDILAGIPLTTQDGLIAGTPGSFGILGIDSAIAVFDAISQFGNSFSTTNGAWYCLNGASGPDTSVNRVLIAQITTEGQFSFELNVQIGTPSGDIEKYVAKNPLGTEIQFDRLSYNSSLDTYVKPISQKENVFTIFPNPSNGISTLNINSLDNKFNNYYTIYDLLGNVIISKKIESASGKYNDKIDLTSKANGLYIITVSLNGVRSTCKLIKK